MAIDGLVEAAGIGVESGDLQPYRVVHDALVSSPDGAVLARFDRPRTPVPARIGVVADPHVACEAEGGWKVFHESRQRLRAALAAFAGRDVDGVVVPGDLSKDGETENLAWAADALATLDVPTLVVPGNHDHKGGPTAWFRDFFGVEDYPLHRRIGGLDVVGVDTADATVDADQCERLDSLLADLDGEQTKQGGEGTDTLVVSHHNLPGLREHLGRSWSPHPPVEGADGLVEVLARHDVGLHLSGHVHLPAVTVAGGVRGLVAPALSSFPQVALLLDVGPTGTTVRCLPVSGPNRIEAAYRHAVDYSERARRIADLTALQFADLPVVDECEQGHPRRFKRLTP